MGVGDPRRVGITQSSHSYTTPWESSGTLRRFNHVEETPVRNWVELKGRIEGVKVIALSGEADHRRLT